MRASTIFICYRRDDSARYANRLKSLLDSKLSRHGVFMDLEIQPGDRFVERVKGAISTCKVLLVLIGPRWLNATDEHGRRRLEDERDFVRLEIAMALERDVVVIPVLVGGGEIPKAHELPDELVPLIERTAIRIRDDRWDDDLKEEDVASLVRTLIARLEPLPWSGAPGVRKRIVAAALLAAAALRRAGRLPRRARLAAVLVIALLVAAGLAVMAGSGPPPVRIGAIYALHDANGNAAQESLAGVQYAIDYVNDGRGPDLDLPLHPGGGLPGIGDGARLELVRGDIKGRATPEARCDVSRAFDRLVTRDRVSAVIGSYESTLTLQGIYADEKLRVPFVADASSATPLTRRDDFGAQSRTTCRKDQADVTPSPWFSRVGPNDEQFAGLFERFLEYERGQGVRVRRVAILHESRNIIGGAAASDAKDAVKRIGRDVTVQTYKYNGTAAPAAGSDCRLGFAPELKGRVAAIASTQPDAIFAVGYVDAAVTIVQAMRAINYQPPALLAFGAGFSRPEFIRRVRAGNPACGLPRADPRGIITRSAFSPLSAGTTAGVAARYFKTAYGREMTDVAARSFTATMALADAIDTARSTDPEAIQSALRRLQVPAVQTILPGGIHFDDSGQNVDARGALLQVQHGRYVPIYPPKLAIDHAHPFWPMREAPR